MNKSDIPNAKASKADETLRQWCVEQALRANAAMMPIVSGGQSIPDPIAFARKIEDYVRGRITTP